MKMSLNQYQMELLNQHIEDHGDLGGVLTEAYTDENMILYVYRLTGKIVKGVVFL